MTAQANDHGSEVVRVRRRRIRLAVVSAVLVAGVVAVIVAFAGKNHDKTPVETASGTTPLSVMSDVAISGTTPEDVSPPILQKDTTLMKNGTKADGGLTFNPGETSPVGGKPNGHDKQLSGNSDNPLTNVQPPEIVQDLSVGLALAGGGLNGLPEDGCEVNDGLELTDAIENQSCSVVYLKPGQLYELEREILVRREVIVMGNPSMLPMIDGEDAIRSFHVLEGGFLDLRFVQQFASDGIVREPKPYEIFATTSPRNRVWEIRGGSVFIDEGALGGKFTGVIFIDDPDVEDAARRSIRRTLDGDVYRIYGGHVFIVGGRVDFVGCLFWDLTLIYTFGNALYIGQDVLQLGGILTFTGCTFFENTVFGVENGLGLFVAQIAGLSTYTFNTFIENNFAISENCLGQAFLVGGGVMIMTTSVINEYSAGLSFSGTGELNVLGGVLVMTGVNNVEAFALGAVYGVGFEYTVGGGVAIFTGTVFDEYNGLFFFGALGEVNFIGSGVMIATGSPAMEYVAQASENGQGGNTFIGAGYASFTGCVVLEFISIANIWMLGEYIAVDAGFLTWIASPFIEAAAVEFARQLGSMVYIGAGAMVLWATPIVEVYGPRVSRTVEFWVMGSCEIEGGIISNSSVGGGGEEGGRRALAMQDRSLFSIPTFIAPLQGCQKLPDLIFGYEKGDDGPGAAEEGGRRARALTQKRRGTAASAASKGGRRPASGLKAPKTLVEEPVRPRTVRSSTRQLSSKQRALRAFFQEGGHTHALPRQVRRHATNLWERSHLEKGDSLTEVDDRILSNSPMEPVLETSLLAMNVTRISEVDGSKIAHLVPPQFLDTFKKIKTQIASMFPDGKAPKAEEDDRPAFYIHNKPDGFCGLCNVPGVEGEGVDGCSVEDSCNDLALPSGQKIKLDGQQTLVEDGEELDYKAHYILMATMSTTTEESVEALDLPEIQEAVVSAVALLQGPSMDKDSIIVNLYTGERDSFFGDHQAGPARSLYEDSEFSKTHTVKMVFVSSTEKAMDVIKAGFDGSQDERNEGPLAEAIKAALATDSGIELGHVSILFDDEVFVPAYNSPLHLTGPHRSLGKHSAVLVDPHQTAVPVTDAKYGKTYHLYLENFPPENTLQLELHRFKDHADAEHIIHNLQSVTTDAEGHARIDMDFIEHILPADYFFKVTTDKGHVSYSQTYTISHVGQKRKLYGTHQYA